MNHHKWTMITSKVPKVGEMIRGVCHDHPTNQDADIIDAGPWITVEKLAHPRRQVFKCEDLQENVVLIYVSQTYRSKYTKKSKIIRPDWLNNRR